MSFVGFSSISRDSYFPKYKDDDMWYRVWWLAIRSWIVCINITDRRKTFQKHNRKYSCNPFERKKRGKSRMMWDLQARVNDSSHANLVYVVIYSQTQRSSLYTTCTVNEKKGEEDDIPLHIHITSTLNAKRGCNCEEPVVKWLTIGTNCGLFVATMCLFEQKLPLAIACRALHWCKRTWEFLLGI